MARTRNPQGLRSGHKILYTPMDSSGERFPGVYRGWSYEQHVIEYVKEGERDVAFLNLIQFSLCVRPRMTEVPL